MRTKECELVKLIYRNQSQGQKVLNIMLLIAFLALIIPYIIGVSNGNHTPWLPMISELDKSPPEGTLWSAGLSLAGLISIPVWIKLYNKWDGQLRSSNADRKYLWFNMLFVIMAQIATVSFIWTVNLPYNEYPVPHGVTAALYFYLTLLLGTIAILVVRKIDDYPKDIIKIRLALNLAGYACMILLGLSVRALSPDVCEAPCKPLFMNAGMEPDHDHIIHYKVAIFEWLMVFTAQIGYFLSLIHI